MLEVLVSMSIMIILFTLSVSALFTVNDMSEDVVKVHSEELVNHAFERAFKNGFDRLGRQSVVEFEYVKRNGKYDTFLTLTNTPDAFDIAYGETNRVDHVCIAAEHAADGWLQIGVYYLTDEDYRQQKTDGFSGLNEVPYIEVVDEAEVFIWRFYDGRRDEWLNEILNFTPSLVELKIKRPEATRAERYVFAVK